MKKFRIITTLILFAVLAFIWIAFSGQEETAPVPAAQEEQQGGYSGLGK